MENIRPALIAFLIFLIAFLIWSLQSQAHAMMCGPPEKLLTSLQATHKETPIGGGISGGIGSMVLTISPVGSWSLLKFYPPARACIVDSGKGWYFYHGKPPKIYRPGTAPS